VDEMMKAWKEVLMFNVGKQLSPEPAAAAEKVAKPFSPTKVAGLALRGGAGEGRAGGAGAQYNPAGIAEEPVARVAYNGDRCYIRDTQRAEDIKQKEALLHAMQKAAASAARFECMEKLKMRSRKYQDELLGRVRAITDRKDRVEKAWCKYADWQQMEEEAAEQAAEDAQKCAESRTAHPELFGDDASDGARGGGAGVDAELADLETY
jgi:hypothetical protein